MTSTRKNRREKEKREKGREREKCRLARCGFAWWSEKIDSVYIYSRNEPFLPRWLRISELRELRRKVRSPVLAFEFLWREAGSRDDNIDPRT